MDVSLFTLEVKTSFNLIFFLWHEYLQREFIHLMLEKTGLIGDASILPTPGGGIKEDVLEAEGISVTETALQLGISRVTLSRLLNGKTGVSVDMALRLSQWLGTTPEVWLRMQDAYDLWQAKKSTRPKVVPLKKRDSG
jgi:addiction module HigA family antidote